MEGAELYNELKKILIKGLNLLSDYENEQYEREKFIRNTPFDQRIIRLPIKYHYHDDEEEINNEVEKQTNNVTVLDFNRKDISKMPQKFRKLFKIGHYKAHVHKRNDSYEIRLMINGHRISASNKVLEVAKKKFIEKLNQLKEFDDSKQRKQALFKDYMLQWLETSKKPYVKENTYKSYLQVFNVNIIPALGKKKLTEITSFDLQEFINNYVQAKKCRTAQKAYQLLKAVFDFAVADEILNRSPMAKIKIGTYEQETGTGLTRLEEKKILKAFDTEKSNLYLQAFLFILYTGIRRSELASAEKNDLWITVTCAKIRKGKKEKKRRIPISPMLKKIINKINLEKLRKINPIVLSHEFKNFMPEHHLHELRHTFITRCQECGIPREFVSVWAGHAADQTITTKVYTHLEQFEDKQIEEISKFIYDL